MPRLPWGIGLYVFVEMQAKRPDDTDLKVNGRSLSSVFRHRTDTASFPVIASQDPENGKQHCGPLTLYRPPSMETIPTLALGLKVYVYRTSFRLWSLSISGFPEVECALFGLHFCEVSPCNTSILFESW